MYICIDYDNNHVQVANHHGYFENGYIDVLK